MGGQPQDMSLVEISSLLRENFDKVTDSNTRYGGKIDSEFTEFDVETFCDRVSTFETDLDAFQESLDSSEEIDSVYARGLDDVRESIEKDLNHIGGQLHTSHSVMSAGADRFKTAEYLENASETADSAIETLEKLTEFVNERREEDYSISAAADTLVQSIETLKLELESLKNSLNSAYSTLSK
jgi:FtsZ-binding cell division protein ZapB